MVLDRDGNLGIGTNTPETPLEVIGVIRTSSTIPVIQLYDNASAESRVEGQFRENANNIIVESLFGDLQFRTGTSASSSTRMTIDGASGNVGIGTTNPIEKLTVVNGSDVTGSAGGFIQLGTSNDLNLGIDSNELQARNDGVPSNMNIQRGGGNLMLCLSLIHI